MSDSTTHVLSLDSHLYHHWAWLGRTEAILIFLYIDHNNIGFAEGCINSYFWKQTTHPPTNSYILGQELVTYFGRE